ncbi:MAG: RNA polymerase subunit sigma-70 [Xanthomonadaceae bacterium]|nr:RNA polymerase subunit sigma-70 [Xanthomonadaceae bacterium]
MTGPRLAGVNAQFTQLLSDWRRGDTSARDRLIEAAYPELRRIANRQLAGERRNHTLQPTALVNEAWMRLNGAAALDLADRTHFVRIAAKLMREILVDHARRFNAAKRDGGERVALTNLMIADERADAQVDVVGLDAVLAQLEQIDPDKGRIVELRYFGGLTIEETADAMAMSPATVKRHWLAARIWLFDALSAQHAR